MCRCSSILEYAWISNRIILSKLKLPKRNVTIDDVYVLVEGIEYDTEEFYSVFKKKARGKFLKRET